MTRNRETDWVAVLNDFKGLRPLVRNVFVSRGEIDAFAR